MKIIKIVVLIVAVSSLRLQLNCSVQGECDLHRPGGGFTSFARDSRRGEHRETMISLGMGRRNGIHEGGHVLLQWHRDAAHSYSRIPPRLGTHTPCLPAESRPLLLDRSRPPPRQDGADCFGPERRLRHSHWPGRPVRRGYVLLTTRPHGTRRDLGSQR